jgi:hypothetical protein
MAQGQFEWEQFSMQTEISNQTSAPALFQRVYDNKVPILLTISIIVQFFILLEMKATKNELEHTQRAIYRNACGGNLSTDKPCRVVITKGE